MIFSPYNLVPLQGRDGVFVNNVSTMAAISHQIENVVEDNALPVTMYVGFQKFSNFLPQQARYERLGRICNRLCVWGVPDVTPPQMPGIEFYPLQEDMELAREWFVIAESAQFFTALLTQENTYGMDVPANQRRYTGIWTYNPRLVSEGMAMLTRMLGLPYHPQSQHDYESQSVFLAQIFAALIAHREQQVNGSVLEQHREALFHSGLTASETPMLLLDGEKTIIAASDTACELLGIAMQQLVNTPLSEIVGGIFSRRDPTQVVPPQMGLVTVSDTQILAIHSRAITNAGQQPIGWVLSLHETQPLI